jgi:hypothetical protein
MGMVVLTLMLSGAGNHAWGGPNETGDEYQLLNVPPKTAPVMLLYNPIRPFELSIFSGPALRFMQAARPHRPKINAFSPREQVQFLERYVFAMCNSQLVNGMDLVFKLETGSENFCGYSPGMLGCFAADNCDAKTFEDAVKYIRGTLSKYDQFVRWSDRRKWKYRGDALNVGFYTRNIVLRNGDLCATLKAVNDNVEPVILRLKSRVRASDGKVYPVFSRPYYVAGKSTLPNLSDENLFAKDTEVRMRKLTAEALAQAKRIGLTDIQAYTGTHERWNCFASSKPTAGQAEFQQIHIEFPDR